MDDTISTTKLLRKYVLAVLKHWYVVATGLVLTVVDLVERILRTWWVFKQWEILSAAAVIFAITQFLAYRDLHLAHAGELKALRDDKEREAEKQEAEKAALQQQIEKLKVKPYDKAQLELVEGKLRGLDETALIVLRFLSQHGPTGRISMEQQLSFPSSVIDGAIANLNHRSLIVPDVTQAGNSPFQYLGSRPITRTLWRVNEQFDQVLRDLLFESPV